jgi:hypothetical protein
LGLCSHDGGVGTPPPIIVANRSSASTTFTGRTAAATVLGIFVRGIAGIDGSVVALSAAVAEEEA